VHICRYVPMLYGFVLVTALAAVSVKGSAAVVYMPQFGKLYDTDSRRVHEGPVEFVKRYCSQRFSSFDGDTSSLAVSYIRFDWNVNIAKLPER